MWRRMWMIRALCLVLVAVSGSAVKAAMNAEDFLQICEAGTLQQVRAALAGGADAKAKDEEGTTVLMSAVSTNESPEVSAP